MYNVGIYLFDEVELLDFAGPYEVFSVTSELSNYSLLKVFTVSRDGNPIKTIKTIKA
jgi:transcriptional regulator GlxA family with amidase domain